MAEYDVQYSIRKPSRVSASGKVTYHNDAFPTKVTVEADSPEQAKRAARNHPTVQRDFNRAFEDNAPKPRVRFFDVKPRGGGAMPNDPLKPASEKTGKLPRRMRNGGLVQATNFKGSF